MALSFFQALIEEREERKKQEALLAAEREKEAKQREADELARVGSYLNNLAFLTVKPGVH